MVKSKGKPGRPLAGENKKSIRTVVSSNSADKMFIEQRAASVNMTASMFLLRLGMDKKIRPPMPAVNRETFLEINAIGRNLNTLNVLLQKNRKFGYSAISMTLESLQKQLAEVRAQLIGSSAYEEADEAKKNAAQHESPNVQNIERQVGQNSEIVM